MQIKGKRVLKNGRTGAYVKQRDGSWRFRFISSGGGKSNNNNNNKSNNNNNNNKLNNNNRQILEKYSELLQNKSKTYGFFSLSPRKKKVSNLLKRKNNVKSKKNLIKFATNTSQLFENSKKKGNLYSNSQTLKKNVNKLQKNSKNKQIKKNLEKKKQINKNLQILGLDFHDNYISNNISNSNGGLLPCNKLKPKVLTKYVKLMKSTPIAAERNKLRNAYKKFGDYYCK
jgi:hypothetical protein